MRECADCRVKISRSAAVCPYCGSNEPQGVNECGISAGELESAAKRVKIRKEGREAIAKMKGISVEELDAEEARQKQQREEELERQFTLMKWFVLFPLFTLMAIIWWLRTEYGFFK